MYNWKDFECSIIYSNMIKQSGDICVQETAENQKSETALETVVDWPLWTQKHFQWHYAPIQTKALHIPAVQH